MPKKHEKGATIWIYATWKDKDGNGIVGLTNDKHTITVTDPTEVDKTGSITVNEDGNGKYHFKYQIPANAHVGEWHVKWTIQYGTDVGIEEHRFEVE